MHTMTSLCRAAGVNASTIRTWERRYGVPKPIRTRNGRRRYSDEEVRRVQLLAELLVTGAQIGDIIQLPEGELALLLENRRQTSDVDTPTRQGLILDQMKEAIVQRDPIMLRKKIGMALTGLPPLICVEDVLAPLMRHVGDLWAAGELPVAVEHVVTAVVRQSVMSASSQQGWTESGRVLLFGTCAGEQHDLGALFAWYLSMGQGLRTVYLGADLPAEELIGAAQMFSAAALVLSMIRPDNDPNVGQDIRMIAESLPETTELWVGRPPDSELDFDDVDRLRIFTGYGDFQRAIQRRRFVEG